MPRRPSSSSTSRTGCFLTSSTWAAISRMRLTELARKYSFIKEIRGFGLMIGIELDFWWQAKLFWMQWRREC